MMRFTPIVVVVVVNVAVDVEVAVVDTQAHVRAQSRARETLRAHDLAVLREMKWKKKRMGKQRGRKGEERTSRRRRNKIILRSK